MALVTVSATRGMPKATKACTASGTNTPVLFEKSWAKPPFLISDCAQCAANSRRRASGSSSY